MLFTFKHIWWVRYLSNPRIYYYCQTIIASVFANGNTVICEARSFLRVGVPSTVTLHVQSEQLGIGRKLPIYPLFPEVTVKIKIKSPFIYLLLYFKS